MELSSGGRERIIQAALRRAIDVMAALMLLVLTAPIMAIIALYIRSDTSGPALFRQQRVGRGGKLFTFYKFRTMYADARQRFPELYGYRFTPEQVQDLVFKHPDDPRVTPGGRWLRKTSLDELPNLLNLLLGNLTLVGPRPDIPEMVRYYKPDQFCKFHVKPGITGLAQIQGRCQLRFQETLRYDVEYVRSRRLTLDMKILIETVLAVITRRGAF
ncbi:MAG: sugar transferase [Chloroflexota bacterium]|nr:MAG: sugar transferase [Chloroflexota bacterium]